MIAQKFTKKIYTHIYSEHSIALNPRTDGIASYQDLVWKPKVWKRVDTLSSCAGTASWIYRVRETWTSHLPLPALSSSSRTAWYTNKIQSISRTIYFENTTASLHLESCKLHCR